MNQQDDNGAIIPMDMTPEQLRAESQLAARVAETIPWADAPEWATGYQLTGTGAWWVNNLRTQDRCEPAKMVIMQAEAQRLPAHLMAYSRPARPFGSPAGYVGVDPVGLKTDGMRPGENPHSGDISGYRKMSDGDVALINEIKAAEIELGKLWQRVSDRADIDARWLHLARAQFEQGFMSLVRSVARPTPRFGAN